ncbi:hypothetical protein ACIB24_04995 [Spongisporangium articulatum]|uniref:Uncharacterized protein n=1 Tax=Spongisporangium articulatum TaxID=3362603 RepID=A0ABW8AL89_9ACTN
MFGPHFRRRRIAAAAVLVATGAGLLGVAQAGGAQAAVTLGQYTATVSPASIPVGTSKVLTVTFTDVAGSLATLGYASVTLPSSFTGISVPSKVTSSAGYPWAVSVSGKTVKLKTSGLLGLGSLLPGKSVSVPVTVTGGTVGTFALATAVAVSPTGTDLIPVFKLKGAAPSVQVQTVTPSVTTSCAATAGSCSTPAGALVGQTAGGQTDSFQITADPGATPAVITASIQYPDDAHRLLCQSDDVDQVLVFNVTGNRAKTIVDDRANNFVGEGANNDICYGSDNPFYVYGETGPEEDPGWGPVIADFNPANGQYEGYLINCNELSDIGVPSTNPCVDSYEFTDDGTVITVKAPAGDPKMTG